LVRTGERVVRNAAIMIKTMRRFRHKPPGGHHGARGDGADTGDQRQALAGAIVFGEAGDLG
jgi:hypothetical protein